MDAGSLYHLLENQIIPLYYAKPDGKLPLAWMQLMRESIRSVTPVFNTHRMVKEYAERLYTPAAKAHQEFVRDECAAATNLSSGKRKCAKIGRKLRSSNSRSATRIAKISRWARRSKFQRKSIWGPSRRITSAWRLIMEKPTTGA